MGVQSDKLARSTKNMDCDQDSDLTVAANTDSKEDRLMNLTRREMLQATAATFATVAGSRPNPTWAAENPYADAVLIDGEPPLPTPRTFTIAVLPDTQYYAEKYPDIFRSQTEWIADQLQDRNIRFVLHLGDVTNHNTESQWKNAVQAMEVLDGRVPYALLPGNHDYSEGGRCFDRQTRLSEFFPVSKFREQATFGGTYDAEPDRMENSFHVFRVGDRKFIVLALEFGPRHDVIRWANEVVSRHRDHEAILITHAYVYFDETRYNWKKYREEQQWNPHSYAIAKTADDDILDGEELWREFVSRHENFILTLNGHVLGDGLGRVTTQTAGRRDVHQMLVNFQMRPNGGDGWLRLLEFDPNGQIVRVCDYSPVRNQRNVSPQNQFELTLSAPL